jgi:hypothetical protein
LSVPKILHERQPAKEKEKLQSFVTKDKNKAIIVDIHRSIIAFYCAKNLKNILYSAIIFLT